jgi:hypothetical protein
MAEAFNNLEPTAMTAKAFCALLVSALLFVSVPASAAAGSGEIPVSTDTSVRTLDNSAPRVTVFPDGGFVVVWGGYNARARRTGIYARFFTADGQPASRSFRLVENTGKTQLAHQVEADRDGSFLLLWDEEKVFQGGKRNIFVSRFDRRGTALGERILVHAPSEFDRSLPVLALAPDGRFAVAWSALFDPRGTSLSDARIRVFSRRGRPLTGEIVAATGVSQPDLNTYAYPAGLVWNPDGSLTLLYGINTVPLGIDTWIVRVPLDGPPTARRQLTEGPVDTLGDFGQDLAVAADGSILATWAEGDIRAQRFTSDVTPVGEPFVLTAAATDETLQKILPLADGSFLTSWNDRGGRDGDGDGVFARLFSLDGTPLARTFRVNRTTAGNQNEGFPAVGRRGPVVVAWATEEDAESGQGQIVLRLLPVGN